MLSSFQKTLCSFYPRIIQIGGESHSRTSRTKIICRARSTYISYHRIVRVWFIPLAVKIDSPDGYKTAYFSSNGFFIAVVRQENLCCRTVCHLLYTFEPVAWKNHWICIGWKGNNPISPWRKKNLQTCFPRLWGFDTQQWLQQNRKGGRSSR